MSAKDPSQYEDFTLRSADGENTVDLKGKTVAFEYFENIFSPVITAKAMIQSTGDAIEGPDGKLQSIYNGLPLRGGEQLSFKIAGNSETNPGLDFSDDPERYLHVESITNVITETKKETFVLNLCSRENITNETSRIGRKFASSPISDSVEKIFKDYLKTNKELNIDKTQNKYGFIGNMRKPFTILTWLASKSVSAKSKNEDDSTAGFVFFETKDGFNFRSVDDLVTQEPSKYEYFFTEVVKSVKQNVDFNILQYSTDRNQDLIGKLRKGAFCSHRMFMNPLTFEYTPYDKGLFKYDDYAGKFTALGEKPKIPEELQSNPSRNITAVLDMGTLEVGVSTAMNADPGKVQSQTMMRYNLLTTQVITMLVPSNTNLKAGDVIKVEVPRIDREKRSDVDQQQSGLYMIKALCHHFDTKNSYTSLELIRDTFGPQEK